MSDRIQLMMLIVQTLGVIGLAGTWAKCEYQGGAKSIVKRKMKGSGIRARTDSMDFGTRTANER